MTPNEITLKYILEERDTALAEVMRLREALTWYADGNNHVGRGLSKSAVYDDAGERARAALAREPKPEGG